MSRSPQDLNPAAPGTRLFPYLGGLGAQRVIELVGLQLAPAVTAAAVASSRLGSDWETFLLLVCILAAGAVLRRRRYPLHLVPFASGVLYLLAAPLGTLVAIAISGIDGPGSEITPSEVVAPVLAAWVVTGMGALVNRRFRKDREVRIGVIGSHEFAAGLIAELKAVGVRGYRVVGCIDPETACPTPEMAGVRCLGSLSWVRAATMRNGIELLVLGPLVPGVQASLSGGEFPVGGVSRLDVFERVADACLDLPVSMIDAGQLYEDLFGHVPLGTTTSAWFQYLLHPRYRAGGPISKRMLDLGLGLIASVIALPLLLIGAVLIKLTDRGPILHRQPRIGAGGESIDLVKLRTMRVDHDGPSWTAGDDSRVTMVGRVLRRTHIDELPQLLLVLKGKMSLVGPRPEQPGIVSDLESRFSYYDRRHLVKPGITGWAQVRCGYAGSHIGSAWKLCHDLYYLKHRSAFFDLLIMLETVYTLAAPEAVDRPDERFIVAARGAGETQALESASL